MERVVIRSAMDRNQDKRGMKVAPLAVFGWEQCFRWDLEQRNEERGTPPLL